MNHDEVIVESEEYQRMNVLTRLIGALVSALILSGAFSCRNPDNIFASQGSDALFCREGVASQYAPGVMERVVRNRQSGRTSMKLPETLPTVDGFVAAERCSDIGQVWTIRYRERVERFLVADCSGSAATTHWMRRNNILVEIDHQTARRWSVVGRGARVEVCRPEQWPD